MRTPSYARTSCRDVPERCVAVAITSEKVGVVCDKGDGVDLTGVATEDVGWMWWG